MKKLFTLLFAFSFLVPVTAQAAADKYTFDTSHTQIMFAVSHMGYSFSHGAFTKFSGGFTFDQENPEASSAEMIIDTASIDLNSEAWNAHMKNEDFFNVEKFPTMTFKSTKVEKTGERTAAVTGDLTILGVTKPVTLAVTFNKAEKRPMREDYVAGFSATGTLKRSEFGMTYGLPMVGDDVTLNIQVEGVREAAVVPAQ